MVVKQDRQWKIPWKRMGLFTLLLIIASGIYLLISVTIDSKTKSKKARYLAQEESTKVKIIDLVSKKYYVTCNKIIISPDNYNIVKVKNTYRLIVGKETKNLDDTYKISDCGVMYDVDAKNLRFKGK